MNSLLFRFGVALLLIIGLSIFLLTSSFASLYWQGIGLTTLLLSILWLISLLIKDSSIIDIYWGLGFVILANFYAFQIEDTFSNIGNVIFLVLVTIWGLRLGVYLAYRNLGKGEDYRYQAMRNTNAKNWWWRSFLQVFMLQGILLWIISALFVPILESASPLNIWHYLGILIWSIGFFFEAVGDWQLMQFKKDPKNKGKVMDKGLWKYTRHPNYFGDATLWWGYFFFALNHPQGIWYFFCPLLMTLLLMRVSGVSLLERRLKKSKPQYEEYIRKTSTFFPWLPKKD